jgi:death-on-curing protein
VKNHALIDGNERLGWLSTAVFLDLNGAQPTNASNDDVYDLVMAVAAGDPPLDEIARALERLARPRRR